MGDVVLVVLVENGVVVDVDVGDGGEAMLLTSVLECAVVAWAVRSFLEETSASVAIVLGAVSI